MKKRICMMIIAGLIVCLSLCACNAQNEENSKDDSLDTSNEQMSEESLYGAKYLFDEEEMNTSESIIMPNDDSEQNAGQMMGDIPNNDVMNFADYDGLVYTWDYDSSSASLLNTGDKLTVNLVIDKDINGNDGFYEGTVELTADQCLTGDGNYSFRGIPGTDNVVSVDFDFCPDGSLLFAAYKDDGGYASCNLICEELAQRLINEDSGEEAQLDNSVLAAFAGEYKNTNGDSFLIEQDDGTGKYKISMVKLYSADGWPEDSDRDGVRYYDTPTIESITGNPDDMIIVETISQYTAGNGTFIIGVNGAADVKYNGYSSSADLNGNYYGYFTK